jgi:hypothetical protein
MVPSFGLPFDCVLLGVGVVWWRQLWRRAGEDWRTFREAREGSEKAAVAILWGVSALWAVWMLDATVGAVRILASLGG